MRQLGESPCCIPGRSDPGRACHPTSRQPSSFKAQVPRLECQGSNAKAQSPGSTSSREPVPASGWDFVKPASQLLSRFHLMPHPFSAAKPSGGDATPEHDAAASLSAPAAAQERTATDGGPKESEREPARSSEAAPRVQRVWHEWLATLARDPEAAYAAALAYRQLDGTEREQWLAALEGDTQHLSIPKVAMYAPLLAVESDRARRRRMEVAIRQCAWDSRSLPESDARRESATHRGLTAWLPSGERLAILIGPLYLGFVQVLACSYVPGRRFLWVRHDPIARSEHTLGPGSRFEGVTLQDEPINALIDDLAVTIVAHRREQLPLPEALASFADWFGPNRFREF